MSNQSIRVHESHPNVRTMVVAGSDGMDSLKSTSDSVSALQFENPPEATSKPANQQTTLTHYWPWRRWPETVSRSVQLNFTIKTRLNFKQVLIPRLIFTIQLHNYETNPDCLISERSLNQEIWYIYICSYPVIIKVAQLLILQCCVRISINMIGIVTSYSERGFHILSQAEKRRPGRLCARKGWKTLSQ